MFHRGLLTLSDDRGKHGRVLLSESSIPPGKYLLIALEARTIRYCLRKPLAMPLIITSVVG